MSLIKKRFFIINDNIGLTHSEQLSNCLRKVYDIVKTEGLGLENVIKQTIFIKANDNNEYKKLKYKLKKIINDFFGNTHPAISVIGQTPEAPFLVAVEAIIIFEKSDKIKIINKLYNKINYVVVEKNQYKEVVVSGLSVLSKNNDTSELSEKSFKLMKSILKKENLTFSNVTRQWNYIENILMINKVNNISIQNYQVFNDIRAKHYNSADFICGFPAATGIGMNTGGVIIDFYAVSTPQKIYVAPISNPKQIDAHQYSEDVLIGSSYQESKVKNPPKFERAKLLYFNDSGLIFISGTASIIGQKTKSVQKIDEQTITTIENIYQLISKNTLQNLNINHSKEPKFVNIRVYVKNEQDIPIVKSICKKYFKETPTLYLVSDICRNELLVEIEGIVEI